MVMNTGNALVAFNQDRRKSGCRNNEKGNVEGETGQILDQTLIKSEFV